MHESKIWVRSGMKDENRPGENHFIPWAETFFRLRRQKQWDQWVATGRAATDGQWVWVMINRLIARAKEAAITERDNVVYWKTKRKIKDDLRVNALLDSVGREMVEWSWVFGSTDSRRQNRTNINDRVSYIGFNSTLGPNLHIPATNILK